eukprot:6126267-Lingulodinium_polyedra.AAC.1
MGDVRTAFRQGDMGDSERQIYGDLSPDARRLLGLSYDDLIKREGSVYGCHVAPIAWFAKVAKYMEKFGG